MFVLSDKLKVVCPRIRLQHGGKVQLAISNVGSVHKIGILVLDHVYVDYDRIQ